MSWSRWPGRLGSCRASISPSRLTVDIWSKFMLFHELCCANCTEPVGALSSTNMHSCSIRLVTHGGDGLAADPIVARVPTSVDVALESSHWFGPTLQSHAAQPVAGGTALGTESPNLQNSLLPICVESPIVQVNLIGARVSARPSLLLSTKCGIVNELHDGGEPAPHTPFSAPRMSFHRPCSVGVIHGAEPQWASRNRARSGDVTSLAPRFTTWASTVLVALPLKLVVGLTVVKSVLPVATTEPMYGVSMNSPPSQLAGRGVPKLKVVNAL
jgi:hypothetical protein